MGELHGPGTMTMPNGDIYTGDFKHNCFQGGCAHRTTSRCFCRPGKHCAAGLDQAGPMPAARAQTF